MFSVRLRGLRTGHKISQEELGKFIGVIKQTVSSWENGNSEPSFEIINKLADFFNVTTDYLLGRTDIPTVTPPQGVVINKNKEENEKMEEKRIPRFAALPFKKKMEAYLWECGINPDDNSYPEDVRILYQRGIPLWNDEDIKKIQNFFKKYYGAEAEKEIFYKNKDVPEFLEHKEYEQTTLSNLLKNKREHKNMTTAQLAGKTTLKESSIISWESAERVPIYESIEKLNSELLFSKIDISTIEKFVRNPQDEHAAANDSAKDEAV